ncbi:MAG TPA: tetratricopeptide repeat protein, partial [bacterium]|nr:tetratricopeptide repeat protein [bacterium]
MYTQLRSVVIRRCAASMAFIMLLGGTVAAAVSQSDRKEAAKYNDQGVDYYEAGMYEEAVASYECATELDPENADAFYGLGMAYLKQKDYRKAFENFEEALFIEPDYPDAHYAMGVIYPLIFKDKKDKAVEHFKKYLKLRPGASDREKVEEWIDRLPGLDFIGNEAHDPDAALQFGKYASGSVNRIVSRLAGRWKPA